MLEGDEADARLAQEQQSTPRRALAGVRGFAEASPDVGELDVAALERAHDGNPDATLELVVRMASATDAALREAARDLAVRLLWRETRRGAERARGTGRMTSRRRHEPGADLDLERSVEVLTHARAHGSAVDPDELWSRQWTRPSTAWCLLLDRSGSMNGAALATACLTTAAFLQRVEAQRAVLAFADDVVALATVADGRTDDEVLDRVLGLRGSGTTMLGPALRAGADQLGRSPAPRRRTVLLSDCRATVPEDVVAAAVLHEELLVLAPADDPAAAYELGRAVGARVETVATPSDVPGALGRLLD